MKYYSIIVFLLLLKSTTTKAQVIPVGTSLDSIYFEVKSQDTPLGEHSNYSFYYYKPLSYNPLTSPILFAIHGDGGNGMSEINDLDSIAEHRHALIVAPNLQTSGTIHIQLGYYYYLDSTLGCEVYGPATDVFKAIYKHVLARESRITIPSYMIGFSAGGQFVTRYMLMRQAYPDSIPLQMAVSSNAAYYTFPTDSFNGAPMPWACGLIFDTIPFASDCSNALNFFNFNCPEHVVQYYNENYGVLIGTTDTAAYGAGCMLDEGANRYERALNFYNFADSNAVTLGTTLQWPYVEIPGINHYQYGMYNTKLNVSDASTIAETLLFDTPYHIVPSLSPFANFYFDTTVVGVSGTVNFTNTSTLATSYLWDFGDNTTSTQVNPSHTYTIAGIYTVQLYAINSAGCDSWTLKRRCITVTGSVPGTVEKFQKTFGATALGSYAYSAQQTNDGGYITFGNTFTSYGAGNDWIFLVKMQSNGDTLWTRMFGGTGTEHCENGQQTFDRGYIVVGNTSSFGAGNKDIFLVKSDSIGNLLWSKTYGGIYDDYGYSVQQTSDSGYIIAGKNPHLIKTNSTGDTLWTKSYNGVDYAYSAVQTTDGGFVLTGYAPGLGAGNGDVVLIKTNKNGKKLWAKTFGGGNVDVGHSVQQTTDKGYIIAGQTASFGNINYDVYLIKTDSSGNLLWSKTYSGYNAEAVQQTDDGGYIIICSYYNGNLCLIKTNPTGDTLWTKGYGTSLNNTMGYSVHQTNDKGYVISGAYAYQYAYLIKTDSLGNSGCNEFSTSLNVTAPATQVTSITMGTKSGCIVTSPVPSITSGFMVNTSCTIYAGINDLKIGQFIIYPNPASDILTVSFNNQLHLNRLVSIIDMQGRVIKEEKISQSNGSVISINVSSLSQGIYLLRVDGVVKRFVKL